VSVIKKNNYNVVTLTASTDSNGSAAYNKTLANNRLIAVRNALMTAFKNAKIMNVTFVYKASVIPRKSVNLAADRNVKFVLSKL